MRIAWFTTYSGRSGIAGFSRDVVEALAADHDVELWVPEGRGPVLDPVAPLVRFTRGPHALMRLHRADAVVYNLGNELHRHRAVAAVAAARPGVVVLHDLVMRHFHGGLVADRTWKRERFLRAVALHDGEDAARLVAARRGRGGDLWSAVDTWEAAPMFGEAIAGAAGVVVHSSAQEERVRAAWAGPLARLDLPARPRAWTPPPAARDRLALVGIGGVTANRRIEDVVAVLDADRELAARVRYVVAGEHPDPAYARVVRGLVDGAGLGGSVELRGYVAPAELDALMADADAFVNLRHPSTEGASASLMEQTTTGRPVLVYDGGSFRDVPAGAAVKVAPGDREGLAAALRELVADPALRARVGAAGAAWAARRTPRAYADALVAFLATVGEQAPLTALCDRVGRALADLDDDGSAAAAAQAIETLLP